MKASNVFDYLKWRGDLPLTRDPLNEVDNLILSMISFIDFSSLIGGVDDHNMTMTLSEAMTCVKLAGSDRMHFGALIPTTVFDLAMRASESVRFGGATVFAFENRIDPAETMQFAAVSFLLSDGSLFAAFRGTDDTLVGWREDLNLSFSEVPAQHCAAAYLARVAKRFPGPIRTGGHSKGGNLAIWAAVHAPSEVRARILTAQSNDGPGFNPSFFELPGYREMEDRILTLIPQSSIVGILLERCRHYKIIRSTQTAIMQHEPCSWVVEATCFEEVAERSAFGRRAETMLRGWIGSMGEEERREFTEVLFTVLSAGNAKTVTDLASGGPRGTAAIARAIRTMDKDQKKRMRQYLYRLLNAGNPKASKAEKPAVQNGGNE